MFRRKQLPHKNLQLFALPFAVSSCSLPPSITLYGAAFPDWLFCIAGGVLLTGCVHLLVMRRRWHSCFSPLIISYTGLTLIFSVALWFLFF